MEAGGILNHFFKNISIVMNNTCNTTCVYCFFHSDYLENQSEFTPAEVSPEFFERVIARLDGFGTNLHIHGDGEPMLHSKIWELIGNASPKVGSVEILTNMINYDEEFVDKLFNHKVDALLVNLPSPNNLNHLLQRPGSEKDFNRILTNLKEIQSRKEQLLEQKPHLIFSLILNKFNASPLVLRRYVSLASELGAIKVKINKMIGVEGTEEFLPNMKDFESLRAETEEFGETKGMNVQFVDFPRGPTTKPTQVQIPEQKPRECTMTAFVNLDHKFSYCCKLRDQHFENFFTNDEILEKELIDLTRKNEQRLCGDCPFKNWL